MWKQAERWGDPMAGRMIKDKEKKKKENKPKRLWTCAPAPNRYNIMPGWCWDGVDRSNGYEVKILTKSSDKVALQEKSYLWSVEDM